MGQQRGGDPVTGRGIVARRASRATRSSRASRNSRNSRASLAGAAIGVAVISALAGCSGSGGNAGANSTPAAQATPTSGPGTTGPATTGPATTGPASPGSASTASSTPSVAAAAAFAPIVEPFDPGHPARTRPAPASCSGQPTTLAIERCYETKIENADAAIDAVQLARYQSAPQGLRAGIVALDSAWLSARQPVCTRAFHGGGTIDEIDVAGCLLAESTARLDAVKRITPPKAVLKSTDSTDPSALSWYTTAGGSRIAMTDTQGDTTGGVIIAWVVIGGAGGFLVNPGQFTYVDGSFTDPGKVQPPNPAGHRVSPGTEYQFSIDYSHLSADPYSGKRTGGWVYAPGAPAAVWR